MKNRVLIASLIALFAVNITSCIVSDDKIFEDGVNIKLAKLRETQLNNIKYYLSLNIPDKTDENVLGTETIIFDFKNIDNLPLLLDFRNPESYIKKVEVNNSDLKYKFENEHIIIPAKRLNLGQNTIKIEFIAGNRALNRNDEYLYTLFVPDRACTAFPCFDQPSLKATFKPEIFVPKGWIAVSNSEIIEQNNTEDKEHFVFDSSEPISTYLFSFVAGKFKIISKEFEDRIINFYHREDDQEKIDRNIDRLFDLKYSSLKWLEEYTQIKYPFKKLDFIAIPSFQYSGMEHPGAVLYRDSKMFLDETATIRDELDRANLIAHETAHMWFGDLVTMEWFSEVWLKEVFANFMAGKIVNPQYPQINHDLNFLINHYPSSYSVDRTKGANPIEQELDNMKNAGTLYGAIIYHKAPIVMNNLEKLIGDEKLKEGLQQYLSDNLYGNASWDDLITILDSKTSKDLKTWSNAWVYESGMPEYILQKAHDQNDKVISAIIEQKDPQQKGRLWSQSIKTMVKENSTIYHYQTELSDTFNVIDLYNIKGQIDYILPNSNGFGYGYFQIDPESLTSILTDAQNLDNPVSRCAIYISLWENMLNKNLKPINLFNSYMASLKEENNAQNTVLLLGYIKSLFWMFLTEKEQQDVHAEVENELWSAIIETNNPSIKSSMFKAYYSISTSEESLKNIYEIWNKEKLIDGLSLSENDFTALALELALKNPFKSKEIVEKQSTRITNEEKQKRFNFIQQAIIDRDHFFEILKSEKNREKEPWVIDALYYLHHPLVHRESIKYIKPSLKLLEEIQITGDIFFPKRWLDATFSGHSTIDAVTEINLFLNENPNYPKNLENKILQSSDLVFRASIIKGN